MGCELYTGLPWGCASQRMGCCAENAVQYVVTDKGLASQETERSIERQISSIERRVLVEDINDHYLCV